MIIEYSMYIIFPIILGFIGERYKDMNTAKYAAFSSFILLQYYLIPIIIEGGEFTLSKIEVILFFSGVFIVTAIFHWQKRLRGIK